VYDTWILRRLYLTLAQSWIPQGSSDPDTSKFVTPSTGTTLRKIYRVDKVHP
jgi:hypothetical protein